MAVDFIRHGKIQILQTPATTPKPFSTSPSTSLKWVGRHPEAEDHFKRSAVESGDFTEMAVTAHSPLSYFSDLSLREFGREDQAKALFGELKAYAGTTLGETAAIDYFATSLPNLLVFEEDLQARRRSAAPLRDRESVTRMTM